MREKKKGKEENIMLVQKYKEMLSGKSVIRELSEFATARGREIGYENVFDYSLGNPSVPVPREFTDEMIHMLANQGTNELHGYSPSLGITSVREAVAASLEKRFGLPYRREHIFMASGAAGALRVVRRIFLPHPSLACTGFSVPGMSFPHASPQFCFRVVQESAPVVHRIRFSASP